MDRDKINNILRKLDYTSESTVTVFGDFCLDKYLYTDEKRDELSLETGRTAYQIHRKCLYPGAAGTVTNNLRAMGAKVYCVGLCGEDGEGFELLKLLEKNGADTRFMVMDEGIQTSTYIKLMRKEGAGDYHEMNRIDMKNFKQTAQKLEERLLQSLEKALVLSDGVVVLDQFLERNCSTVTDRIRKGLEELGEKYPEKFFYADSRGFSDCYRGMIIKCNQYEVVRAVGKEKDDPEELNTIIRCGKALSQISRKPVVVTMGIDGACVIDKDTVTKVPAFHVEGPIDIVGAGDATNAGIVLGLSLGLTLPEAVLLGGCISSVTIQQIGVTGVASVEKVKERMEEKQKFCM